MNSSYSLGILILTFVLAQSANSVRSAGNDITDKAATTIFVGLPITIFSCAKLNIYKFLNDVE